MTVRSKVALRLAYLGTAYNGFQAQPNCPTVQAAVMHALRDTGALLPGNSAGFSASGRTDKGVHAVDAVISFEAEDSASVIPRRVNSKLPSDIWAWAQAAVPITFDARRDAVEREYQYILYKSTLDVHLMQQASDLLCGTHDFRNFSHEKKRSTVREIITSSIRATGNTIIITVVADSFVWQMMRKIVTALSLVGEGQKSVEWFARMLNPRQHVEGLCPAPAVGLVLTRVEYPGIHFIEDTYAKKRALQHIQDSLAYNATLVGVLELFRARTMHAFR
ncbi:MAG: tRNA pseudouridine(38-40) synthase TruA [Halobacteriota archaeon]